MHAICYGAEVTELLFRRAIKHLQSVDSITQKMEASILRANGINQLTARVFISSELQSGCRINLICASASRTATLCIFKPSIVDLLQTRHESDSERVEAYCKKSLELDTNSVKVLIHAILEPLVPEHLDKMANQVDLGCGSGSLFNALLDEETDLICIVGVDFSQKYLFRAAKVDLGCGSGSLFNALLDEKTDLICIVGVDISQKYLFRAAKEMSFLFGTLIDVLQEI